MFPLHHTWSLTRLFLDQKPMKSADTGNTYLKRNAFLCTTTMVQMQENDFPKR